MCGGTLLTFPTGLTALEIHREFHFNLNRKVEIGVSSLIWSFSVCNCQETSANMIQVPWLVINYTSFPYISMHFFYKNKLSWLELHWGMGGSTWLMFDQFFPNSGSFPRLSNTRWNLRK